MFPVRFLSFFLLLTLGVAQISRSQSNSLKSVANIYNVLDFGAKGDGRTLNTKSIQLAVDAAAKTSGTILIPNGNFLSGTIFLRSNVRLELTGGSVLMASPSMKDYIRHNWGPSDNRTPWHLLVADKAKNISISGTGTINGDGSRFWKKERANAWVNYEVNGDRPCPLLEFSQCENVLMENVTIANSPGWTSHFISSKNLTIRNLTISNSLFAPDGDGLILTGCSDVNISDCRIATSESAIAVRTTANSGPSERIAIRNCILETMGIALQVGYESRQAIRDVIMAGIVVKNCSRILDIRSAEGGILERIHLSEVSGQTNSGKPANRIIEIDLNELPDLTRIKNKNHPDFGKMIPLTGKGAIRDVSITDVDVQTDGRIMMAAADGIMLENIFLDNIHLRYTMIDNSLALSKRSDTIADYFKGSMDLRTAPAAVAVKNINGFSLDHFRISWPVFPVADSWNLLKSDNRFLEPGWYKDNESRIKSGELKPTFKAFWGKNVKGGLLELSTVRASEPGIGKTECTGCSLTIRE